MASDFPQQLAQAMIACVQARSSKDGPSEQIMTVSHPLKQSHHIKLAGLLDATDTCAGSDPILLSLHSVRTLKVPVAVLLGECVNGWQLTKLTYTQVLGILGVVSAQHVCLGLPLCSTATGTLLGSTCLQVSPLMLNVHCTLCELCSFRNNCSWFRGNRQASMACCLHAAACAQG